MRIAKSRVAKSRVAKSRVAKCRIAKFAFQSFAWQSYVSQSLNVAERNKRANASVGSSCRQAGSVAGVVECQEVACIDSTAELGVDADGSADAAPPSLALSRAPAPPHRRLSLAVSRSTAALCHVTIRSITLRIFRLFPTRPFALSFSSAQPKPEKFQNPQPHQRAHDLHVEYRELSWCCHGFRRPVSATPCHVGGMHFDATIWRAP